MMEVKERWRACKGIKKTMCSDQGNFLVQNEEGIWAEPAGLLTEDQSVDTIAQNWLGMKKNQKVEFVNGDPGDWAVANLRVVDIQKNLTIKMKFNKDQINKDMVEQVLKYVPETGAFLVKTKRPNVGSEAWKHAGEVGTYYMIHLFGQWYKAQEIAVLIVNGDWPREPVEVKNGNWGDARWSNIVA